MRVALVQRVVAELGGTERFALGFARWLAREGCSVHLWCERAEGLPAEVALRPLRVRGRGRIGRLLGWAWATRAVPREDYDVVIGLGRAPGADLYRAGGGCHRAWIEARGWSLADAVELAVDRRVVLGARRVVANSAMAGAELLRWYGLPPDRLAVVHNGVDLGRFQPLLGQGASREVVFLGSGYARKGLDTALRVLARIPGISLAVAGAERRPDRFVRLAARLGVSTRGRWLGAVANPERLLAGAAAALLPTRYDPFANATLEALACGIPAITSGRDGASEVLPEPWMAVSDPEDVTGFAEALERALHMPGLRAVSRDAAARWPAENAFAALADQAETVARAKENRG